jgi:hypothetical protein
LGVKEPARKQVQYLEIRTENDMADEWSQKTRL